MIRATLRIIAAEPSLIVVLLWWRVVWPVLNHQGRQRTARNCNSAAQNVEQTTTTERL